MYKVTYYITGGTLISTKTFPTFSEAMTFASKQPRESVIEIKLYPDENKKRENRT